jgi:hypothetical protein
VGAAFLVLAALLYFWRGQEIAGGVAGALGALLALAGLAVPGRLGPVHRAWMGLARVISKVTTPVFMGVVFFLVITPVGWVMRLFGKRPLAHKERDGSLWAARGAGGRSDLERQF